MERAVVYVVVVAVVVVINVVLDAMLKNGYVREHELVVNGVTLTGNEFLPLCRLEVTRIVQSHTLC